MLGAGCHDAYCSWAGAWRAAQRCPGQADEYPHPSPPCSSLDPSALTLSATYLADSTLIVPCRMPGGTLPCPVGGRDGARVSSLQRDRVVAVLMVAHRLINDWLGHRRPAR